MLAYPITAAILVVGSGSAAAVAPREKHAFMRAMKRSHKRAARRLTSEAQTEFKKVLYGNTKQSVELRKKFISKSTHVKEGEGRKLQNYNNGNGGNNNYNNNYRWNSQRDGSDDYFAAYGEWQNNFGFDATQYSLSYLRCASVRQFDAEIAAMEDTDTVFATKRFAVFRFCPEQTCMGFVEEGYDCGCEDQCDAILTEMQNNGYDGDCDACEEACSEQCDEFVAWQKAGQTSEYKAQQNQGGMQTVYDQYGNPTYTFNMYYAMEKEADEAEEPLGARGEGCQENYGEYLIEVEEYLSLMLEFQEERFETYCGYCEECMYNVYQVWLKNGGYNHRNLKFEEFKAMEHQEMMRELGGNVNGGYAWNKFYNVCPEYDTCSEYQNICKQGMDESYADYFECTEVEKNNGQVAYIGPHCAEDGFTITLGVFADEYCNEYIGHGVDIANFLGEEVNLEEDMLKSYYNSMNGALDILKYSNEDDVCIPCRKADMPYEESQYVAQTDDVQEAQNNYGENEINEICENLYKVSARCDKHFRSYNTKSKQAKYAEAVAQEDLTCDFIDTIVMGNYNEMGLLNFGDNYTIEKQGNGWLSNNMYAQQTRQEMQKVQPLQIFGLIMSILAVVILAAWSTTLHRSLSKRGPWRPRRGLRNVTEPDSAADLSRQNSGIVMGRSQSNASYYMT